jgi:DNA-binding CsgD family transcriptional regulator
MVSLPKEKLPDPLPHESSPFSKASHHPQAEYPFSQGDPPLMAQLALTHTPVEHLLYQVMLAEVTAAGTRACTFSSRHLMTLTRLPNYSAVRRGLQGLINKQSVEHYKVAGGDAAIPHEAIYLVYTPEEIFARRRAAHFDTSPSTAHFIPENNSFAHAIERLAERYDLSRREIQVALCCAQGLTNAEIGERLFISEQTVKFHLRHVYLKYGVRRRAELISRLLAPDS